MSERKREFEEEASSTIVSHLKKTKLHDSDSPSDSHDVVDVAAASSSYSIDSSADSASEECSGTSTGEEDDQSSSISSGCFSSESKEIAKNRSTFGTDLEAQQISETETKTETLITSNFRKETSPVSEEMGEITTEMESSLDNRRKPPADQVRRKNPTPTEIEEFFSELENEDDKQKQFIEKYNFDIVNDEPLEGRYMWVRLIKP